MSSAAKMRSEDPCQLDWKFIYIFINIVVYRFLKQEWYQFKVLKIKSDLMKEKVKIQKTAAALF